MKKLISILLTLCLALACLPALGESAASNVNLDDYFSKRDLKATWDESEAETITLTGGSATELATYDLSGGLEIAGNIALAEPPDFVCTNDIYHADFYRYRSSRGAAMNLGVLGWNVSPGEYPLWIGALPPLYPESTLMILR